MTELDSRRAEGPATQSAASWLGSWIRENAGPDGWVKPADALAAAAKAGHKPHAIIKAKQIYADPPIESSGTGRRSMWRIATTGAPAV